MATLMSKLSIVVPVYFNAPTLVELHTEFARVFEQLQGVEGEMVFVDDGSRDNSFEVLSGLAARDPRCKVIKLSRNHGSHIAMLAGLHYCTGDCAVIISADLQDPPGLITEMHKHWQDGYASVLAVRADRDDPITSKLFASLFYRIMKRFAIREMPVGGFDFALIDRKVVDTIVAMNEKNSHLMTQILWTGFTTKLVPYKRSVRKVRKSRWTFARKVKLFVDSLTAFSYAPLRLVSLMGFCMAIAGLLYAIVVISLRLTRGSPVEGWSSLMVVVLVAAGAQLLGLGIIGEYLWRNLDETRKRPVFVVDRLIGFDR